MPFLAICLKKMGIHSFKDAKGFFYSIDNESNECRNQNFLLKPYGTKIRMRLHSFIGTQVVIEVTLNQLSDAFMKDLLCLKPNCRLLYNN